MDIAGLDVNNLFEYRLDNYCHFLAIAILYYDHALTLPMEMDLVWRAPKRLNSYLFFLNRYFAFLGHIVVTATLLHDSASAINPARLEQRCDTFWNFRNVLVVATQIIVGLLLSQRVYGLYGCSRRILYFLGILAITLGGLSSVALFISSSNGIVPVMTIEGCHAPLDSKTARYVAFAWEGVFSYDVVLFVMTMLKARQRRRDELRFVRMQLEATSGRQSLATVLIRDGFLYFLAMTLANLSNILSFYFTAPAFRGGLATFASCISVTMMSRLMLNLRAQVEQDSRTYSRSIVSQMRFA
ncbi:hypothetical protein K435DRAFT_785022 [Dendrothele bispora CBS 962.96]|uniref:DUF6533 domain-containing protein n=1 Tax=Dendrothele bispora (strain CBS 962.96) TaxID=1314807 RepID=A0A4S8L0H6_DENBC|nr:hypothetical protein K435DRAFT_785022 [Dendrothele bispora CBS 962.96]